MIFKSGYLRKFVGVLLAIGGVSYLIDVFANFLAPALSSIFFLQSGVVAEFSLTLWLIVMALIFRSWESKQTAGPNCVESHVLQ